MAVTSKKGIFFTFAAIALSVVIIFSFNSYTKHELSDDVSNAETRISSMNSMINNLENDMDNAIFIAGFRSLLSLEDYMMSSNPPKFLNQLGTNLNDAFEEVFKQGTINSQKMALMENNSFANWTNNMKLQANKTGIELEFNINDVTITQSEPWMVDISVDLEIDVNDSKNTASWTINKVFTEKLNITGFVDPLYLVNTNGVANNTLRQTLYSNWPGDLSAHLNNAYYRTHADAPSYLDRFENKLTSSPYGIESLVTERLKAKGLSVSAKSAVDYIYFGTSNPASCNVVAISDTDFYLDAPAHTGFYGTSCVP